MYDPENTSEASLSCVSWVEFAARPALLRRQDCSTARSLVLAAVGLCISLIALSCLALFFEGYAGLR